MAVPKTAALPLGDTPLHLKEHDNGRILIFASKKYEVKRVGFALMSLCLLKILCLNDLKPNRFRVFSSNLFRQVITHTIVIKTVIFL
jgi:hypothetical protein